MVWVFAFYHHPRWNGQLWNVDPILRNMAIRRWEGQNRDERDSNNNCFFNHTYRILTKFLHRSVIRWISVIPVDTPFLCVFNGRNDHFSVTGNTNAKANAKTSNKFRQVSKELRRRLILRTPRTSSEKVACCCVWVALKCCPLAPPPTHPANLFLRLPLR